MEWYRFERTLAFRNCNPLNIRFSKSVKWQGQNGEEGGFVKFTSFSYGYRAAVKILRSYAKRDIKAIGKIIETWAPQTENNTKAYVKAVLDYLNGVWRMDNDEGDYCARTQINLRDREEVVNLLMAMTRVEMGANAAQLHDMKRWAYVGYDLAVTTNNFFG